MSSKNYDESGYSLDLDLLDTSYYLCDLLELCDIRAEKVTI